MKRVELLLSKTTNYMKLKVLVMENVGNMEPVLGDYINQTFPDCELILLNNLQRQDTKTILENVAQCDIICVQSLFTETTTFGNMVELFYAKPELLRPTYIIHTTGKLLEVFNTCLASGAYSKLTLLLEKGLKLYNIYFQEYDHPDNDPKEMFARQYFRKILRMFDTVPVWYNAKDKIIWDERPYYVPRSTKTYFKPEAKAKAEKKTLVDCLSPKEIKTLQELLREMYSFTSEKLEDLEIGACDTFFSPKEVKELTDEKTEWIRVLEKIGIS